MIISKSDWPIFSKEGLRTYSSSIKPTLAPAIGPMNGTSAIDIAAEAANIATTSGGLSLSKDNNMQFT